MLHLMRIQLPDVPITTDESHVDNNYYKGINFKMYMHTKTETIEIGDGGFTDWTQKIMIYPFLKELGLDQVLITCNSDNIASVKMIEGCGE